MKSPQYLIAMALCFLFSPLTNRAAMGGFGPPPAGTQPTSTISNQTEQHLSGFTSPPVITTPSSNQKAPPIAKQPKKTPSGQLTAQQRAQAKIEQNSLSLSLDGQQASDILASKSASLEQKGVVLFRNHTKPNVSPADLAKNPLTAGAKQVTFQNKKDLSPVVGMTSRATLMSFTHGRQKFHPMPTGGGITSNGQLNGLYNKFMDALKKAPGFLPTFRKLHIIVLHQIYEYLMGIHTALNMTLINDLETYVTLEHIYRLNEKTLIINHLINIIEAQLNQAIRALMPQIPKSGAVNMGVSCMKSDRMTRLDLLLVDLEQVVFEIFQSGGVTPQQWLSVFQSLMDPAYAKTLAVVNQTGLDIVKKKLAYYLTKSMDLSTNNTFPDHGDLAYVEAVTKAYKQPPESTYFKGAVPPASTWETKIEELSRTTSDVHKFPRPVSLLKQLTADDHIVLTDALDLLVAQFAGNQQLQDIVMLIPMLKEGTQSKIKAEDLPPLSFGQYMLLLTLVKGIAFLGPLDDEINLIKKIYPQLLMGDLIKGAPAIPLTEPERKALNGAISYVSLRTERGMAAGLNDTVAAVQKLLSDDFHKLSRKEQQILKQFTGMSALTQSALKLISSALIKDPTLLSRLPVTDYASLIAGFSALALRPTEFPSAATRSLFNEVAEKLKKGPISATDLSIAENQAYATGLAHFAKYDAKTTDLAAVEAKIAKLFPEKTPDGKSVFEQVAATLSTPESKKPDFFSTRTPSELLMILAALQGTGRVIDSRIVRNTKNSTLLASLFKSETELEEELFKATSVKDYLILDDVYKKINPEVPSKIPFSLSTLTLDERRALADVLGVLVIPEDGTRKQQAAPKSGTHPTFLGPIKKEDGLLQIIQKRELQNHLMVQLIQKLNLTDYSFVQGIFAKLRKFSFVLDDLTADEKIFLIGMLQKYQDELESPANLAKERKPLSQKNAGLNENSYPLLDANEINVEGVLPVLHTYAQFKQTQQAFLSAFGDYLDFFSPYTATLQQGSGAAASSNVNAKYMGLTQFEEYAKSISELVKKATFPDGSPMKISDQNPPLFFYDEDSLKEIRMIPFLASTIKDGLTQNVPLPTFGVDAALSTHPSSSNAEESNFIIDAEGTAVTVPSLLLTAEGHTYSPKFFFKDEFGNPFGNTPDLFFSSPEAPSNKNGEFVQEISRNPKIPWLEKRTVPTQNPTKNKTYVFVPATDADGNIIKRKGEEGFYMNIPMTTKNPLPTQNARILIRLYEQAILPQPDWLNSEQGVIKMLRVCLGDFAEGLSIDEQMFDPCVQMIIRKALATLPQLPASFDENNTFKLSAADETKLAQECQLHLVRGYLDAKNQEKAQHLIATGVK